ncbi:MAG TPA: putative maltokinase [Isosphaeraceae bacterium]|nr:putative maltokinase [Isosphaeraceae bacterium]
MLRVESGGINWSLGSSRDQLERDILPDFLRRQRWFAGKARKLETVRLARTTPPGALPGSLVFSVVEAAFADGGRDRYLLPLSVSSGADANRLAGDPRWCVARLEAPDGPALLHDALADPAACQAVLSWLSSTREVQAGDALIRGVTTDAFSTVRGPTTTPLPVKVSSAEQSNSAVIFGDRLILKLFRRLEPGLNPDFEIGRYLTEQTAFDRIPQTAGAIELVEPGQQPTTLAILQGLVPNQGTGWEHALNQLNDYYARARSAADPAPEDDRAPLVLANEPIPASATSTLGPAIRDAETLGRRTAELHLALGSETPNSAFQPQPYSKDQYASLAHDVREQVERSLQTLQENLDRLSGVTLDEALRVLDHSGNLLAQLDELTHRSPQVDAIRVHGDYHLGQVLRVQDDYVLLDFEGEPARPLAKRLEKQLPIKDVVGMLRSFDYAAYAGLFAATQGDPEAASSLAPWARAWRLWTSVAFLKAYLDKARDARFLPQRDEDLHLLLSVFTIDKSLYELLYEMNNRPDWVRIPLQGVLAILDERDAAPGSEPR